METLSGLFSEQFFMPHGHCYLWTPSLLWMQVVTNGLIGLSYVVISLTLADFVRRVKDLPLRFVYVAFGVFIIACGFSHFMDILVIWAPRYWLDTAVRVVTAVASVGTAAALPRFVPRAVRLFHGARRMRKRGVALEAAVSDLETLYQRAQQLDELKTNFFANVSHELRTPLTLILAPVEGLLKRQDLDREVRRDLDLVRRNALGLLNQVNDLLDIAKFDVGKLDTRYGVVDLAQLVRAVAANFEPLAHERNLAFELTIPPELFAELDAEKVSRVVLNLLSNAFKFAPAGGVVRVSLARTGQRDQERMALLQVADSGPGVNDSERDKIFERFGQGGARSERPLGGSGLGLAIVRDFVRLHGGDVSVGTAPEGGALFEVRLPLSAPRAAVVDHSVERKADVASFAAPSVARPESPAEDRADPPPQPDARPTVLLAEDNPDMRMLVARMLSKRYRVVQAEDGEEALRKARNVRPDLIVSDIMMPKLSGDQLVHAVRATSELDAVPVLLLTAKADEALRTRLLQSGAQDYLLKPFGADELLARVGNLVTIKRTRDLLQSEVEAQQADIELLSQEVVAQKHALSCALAEARGAREQAETASRAKSDFLSLVSHELRTPLTSTSLQLERLRRGLGGDLSETQQDILVKISRAQARLLDMVDTLLEFGRLESGRVAVQRTQLDLVAAIREVMDCLRPRAEAKGLAFVLDAPEGQIAIESDPKLVRLVLINLVDNAIKYTDRGEVRVLLERSEQGPRVRVHDTGPGIDPSLKERVFEPFQQLQDVRHKNLSGVGLGLALVRGIAGALGVQVSLESEKGQGSVFTVGFGSMGGA